MFQTREAFEVVQRIVGGVGVDVVDVAARWNTSECGRPNITVKTFTTAREIAVTREATVEAAVEIPRESVQADWMLEVGLNSEA